MLKSVIFLSTYEYPFLGESLDGLVSEITTVEIKRPSLAKDLIPEDATRQGNAHSGHLRKMVK